MGPKNRKKQEKIGTGHPAVTNNVWFSYLVKNTSKIKYIYS